MLTGPRWTGNPEGSRPDKPNAPRGLNDTATQPHRLSPPLQQLADDPGHDCPDGLGDHGGRQLVVGSRITVDDDQAGAMLDGDRAQ